MNICEIGSGWGQSCEILNQKYNLNSYTSIDLKETLILAYLNAVGNYQNDDINLVDNDKNFKKYNFCIPEKIKLLENNKYDVFINCFSFQEMSKINVNNYINFIHKTLKKGGIFISINSCNYLEINNYTDYNFHSFNILDISPSLRFGHGRTPVVSCMKNEDNIKEYKKEELDNMNKIIYNLNTNNIKPTNKFW